MYAHIIDLVDFYVGMVRHAIYDHTYKSQFTSFYNNVPFTFKCLHDQKDSYCCTNCTQDN